MDSIDVKKLKNRIVNINFMNKMRRIKWDALNESMRWNVYKKIHRIICREWNG